jgi:hypothetical protein
MVDNFAIPAATIRGLFDYDYKSERLIIRPRVPGSITLYQQKEPVRFGEKKLFLSCKNGGPKISSVKINGKELKLTSTEDLALIYEELSNESHIEITTTGGWPGAKPTSGYPVEPSLQDKTDGNSALPETLKKPYNVLLKMKQNLEKESDVENEKAMVNSSIQAIESCRERLALQAGPGYFRPITPERKEGINKFYEQTAISMYQGFSNRMKKYAENGDVREQKIAAIFNEVQKPSNH